MKKLLSFLSKFIKNPQKRGDSILEVMIAVVLLSSILTATFTILTRAIDTNINVKNRVIALNISREGLEAVRNIRDTNWLKYSGDRRSKWLCHDTPSNPNACQGSFTSFLSKGSYTVNFDSTQKRYYLEKQTESVIINNVYKLYLDAKGRYTHESSDGDPTIFHRKIELEILNPYEEEKNKDGGSLPDFCDTDNSDCKKARIKIVATTGWEEEGRKRLNVLETHLFDFFERESY